MIIVNNTNLHVMFNMCKYFKTARVSGWFRMNFGHIKRKIAGIARLFIILNVLFYPCTVYIKNTYCT